MKKLVALLLALCMVACLFVGCAEDTAETTAAPEAEDTTAAPEVEDTTEAPSEEDPSVEDTTEAPSEETPAMPALEGTIAFITDTGTIDDHSFNQYSYEGVQLFGDANGIGYQYYKPTEDSDQARIDAMNQAIADGAKVIVMAGYLFGTAVHQVATENPEVLFLALDVSTADLPGEAPANLALITYKEEQAGYLAGYAAVMGGFTKLGFLGGIDVPAVVRYGYGFVQGADAAAAVTGSEVSIEYWYSGSFAPNDEILAKMNGWYTAGTEIVFSCGGGIYLSCVTAAEANNGYVIGVDVDQSNESTVILTSAMKALSNSVQVALGACGNNGWAWTEQYAGQQVVLGAAEDCVGLPMENTFLDPFDQAAYDALFAQLVDGTIVVSDAIDAQPAVANVTVNYQ